MHRILRNISIIWRSQGASEEMIQTMGLMYVSPTSEILIFPSYRNLSDIEQKSSHLEQNSRLSDNRQ